MEVEKIVSRCEELGTPLEVRCGLSHPGTGKSSRCETNADERLYAETRDLIPDLLQSEILAQKPKLIAYIQDIDIARDKLHHQIRCVLRCLGQPRPTRLPGDLNACVELLDYLWGTEAGGVLKRLEWSLKEYPTVCYLDPGNYRIKNRKTGKRKASPVPQTDHSPTQAESVRSMKGVEILDHQPYRRELP